MKKFDLTKIVMVILIVYNFSYAAIDWHISEGTETISGESYGDVEVTNDAVLNMYDGYIDGLYISGNATVNIHGGTIGWSAFRIGNQTSVNLYGGTFQSYLFQTEPITLTPVHVYGYDFNFDGQYLTGYWENGEEFSLFLRMFPIEGVMLHEIPEPMTLLLFGLGGLIVFKKRNINNK